MFIYLVSLSYYLETLLTVSFLHNKQEEKLEDKYSADKLLEVYVFTTYEFLHSLPTLAFSGILNKDFKKILMYDSLASDKKKSRYIYENPSGSKSEEKQCFKNKFDLSLACSKYFGYLTIYKDLELVSKEACKVPVLEDNINSLTDNLDELTNKLTELITNKFTGLSNQLNPINNKTPQDTPKKKRKADTDDDEEVNRNVKRRKNEENDIDENEENNENKENEEIKKKSKLKQVKL
eukprot:Pgem_evm1s6664